MNERLDRIDSWLHAKALDLVGLPKQIKFQFSIRAVLIASTLMAAFIALNKYVDLIVLKSRKLGTIVWAYQGWPRTHNEFSSYVGHVGNSGVPAEFDGKLSMELQVTPMVFNVVFSILMTGVITFLTLRIWPRSSAIQRIAFFGFVGAWVTVASGVLDSAFEGMDWYVIATAFANRLVPDFVREMSSRPLMSWPFNDYVRWQDNPTRTYSVHLFWSAALGLLSVWVASKIFRYLRHWLAGNIAVYRSTA